MFLIFWETLSQNCESFKVLIQLYSLVSVYIIVCSISSSSATLDISWLDYILMHLIHVQFNQVISKLALYQVVVQL